MRHSLNNFLNMTQDVVAVYVVHDPTNRQCSPSLPIPDQMSTSAGWDGVLNALIDEDDCEKDDPETGMAGNCGNTAMGIGFLLCYLVISFLIIINMYIAVILENYSQVREH